MSYLIVSQHAIAEYSDRFLQITSGSRVPEPPSEEVKQKVLQDVDRGHPMPLHMVPDFTGKPSSDYNRYVKAVFVRRFVDELKANVRLQFRVSEVFRDDVNIGNAFQTHLVTVKRRWIEQAKPRTAEQKKTRASTFARSSRKTQVFLIRSPVDALINICLSQLSRTRLAAAKKIAKSHVQWLRRLGARGVSSDEEDGRPAPAGHALHYIKYERPWRSDGLINMYHQLDGVHGCTRNKKGNPIRDRISLAPGSRISTKWRESVPRALPINYYSKDYLDKLTPLQLCLLEPKAGISFELDAGS